ncbi:transposase [Deinococcus taklimakanensis]|uniref:Transposase n=1 Tax=Deinococcus taklimakanensis TaxID=536443 RepID=A0ABW5P5H2_9DEIO
MEHHLTRLTNRPDLVYNLPSGVTVTDQVIYKGVIALHGTLAHRPDRAVCRCKPHPKWQRSGSGKHTYRTPPVAGRPVILTLTYPVYRCAQCKGSSRPALPAGMITDEFGRMIGDYALRHPTATTARHFRVERTTVTRWADIVAEERLASRVVLPPDILGLDDTTLSGKRRLVVVDIPRARHIDLLEGYSERVVTQFLAEHRAAWQGVTRAVVIDRYTPFRNAIAQAWPDLRVVLDRFHVAQPINSAARAIIDGWRARHPGAPSLITLHRRRNQPGFAEYLDKVRITYPPVVEAFEYSQEWQALYAAADARAAEHVWTAWVARMPALLRPGLRTLTSDITNRWLLELTAAVEVRGPTGVVASNGATERLNRHAAMWASSNMQFHRVRSRVLLMPSAGDQEDAVRVTSRHLEEALDLLHGEPF